MAKQNSGFTLIEILIGISIVAVLAIAAIPDMRSFLDKQALKTTVSQLDTYVDQARNMASITECPVQMNLKPDNNNVTVSVTVNLNPFLKGCSAWHAQTNSSANTGFTNTLEDVTITAPVSLSFSAVSGVMVNNNATTLTMNYRDWSANVKFLGIGSGVVNYVRSN